LYDPDRPLGGDEGQYGYVHVQSKKPMQPPQRGFLMNVNDAGHRAARECQANGAPTVLPHGAGFDHARRVGLSGDDRASTPSTCKPVRAQVGHLMPLEAWRAHCDLVIELDPVQ
jgi:hypothetical protein